MIRKTKRLRWISKAPRKLLRHLNDVPRLMDTEPQAPPKLLLAVDLGMKMGCALFGDDGRLTTYYSRKISGRQQLKTAVYRMIHDSNPSVIYLEGGGDIADLWTRTADKAGIPAIQVHSDSWRNVLL